jgi:hypothetical protein
MNVPVHLRDDPLPPRGSYRDQRSDESPEVTTCEARSGETSGHVRTILGVSLALTVLGMAIALAYWFAQG